MPTIFTIGKLRIVIYPNDHDPPHVHVIAPDGNAKVRIGTAHRKPSVVFNDGVSLASLPKALIAIDERRDELQKAWRKHHG